MEPPTPGGVTPTSNIRHGRDADQINDIKKLIISETDKLKNKWKAKGAIGSDSEDEGDAAENEVRKVATEADEAAKKVKPKGVWRKGKFIPYEETEEGRYRDRAKERRVGLNPDYDGEIERMVEIDAEKSKYLGGDLKHTHLVKGLDYALLMKVKEEAKRKEEEDRIAKETLLAQSGLVQKAQVVDSDNQWRPPTFRTYSGKALYAALQAIDKPKAPNFKRIAYEYDLSTDTVSDVPTMLSRCNADTEADLEDVEMDLRINFVVDDKFLAKLTTNLNHFRIHGKSGRRRKRNRDSSLNTIPQTRIKASDVVDIFADISFPFADSNMHIIPQNNDASMSDNFVPPLPPSPSKLKGKIFSGLGTYSRDSDDENDSSVISKPDREEIARSIKRAAESSTSQSKFREIEGGKIDRDVFRIGESQKQGQSMGSGTYEVFPETAEFGDVGSDEEGEPNSKLGKQLEKKTSRKRRSRV